MAKGKPGTTLIAFESGHYKEVHGSWKGDSVWAHFHKEDGGMIHVNKDKVEYTEDFGVEVDGLSAELVFPSVEEMINDLIKAGVLRRRTTDPPGSAGTREAGHIRPGGRPPRPKTAEKRGGKKKR